MNFELFKIHLQRPGSFYDATHVILEDQQGTRSEPIPLSPINISNISLLIQIPLEMYQLNFRRVVDPNGWAERRIFVIYETDCDESLEAVKVKMNDLMKIQHTTLVEYIGFAIQDSHNSSFNRRLIEIGVLMKDYEHDIQLKCLSSPTTSPAKWLPLAEFVFLNKLQTDEILVYASLMLEALSFLHNHTPPIVLGGLRSESVMVAPHSPMLKIHTIFSTYMSMTSWRKSWLGSDYMHPDLIELLWNRVALNGDPLTHTGKDFDFDLLDHCHADIWSLGCMVLDIVTQLNLRHVDKNGILLDKFLSPDDFCKAMINGGSPYIPGGTHPVIRQLCERCFERDVEYRLSSHELLKFLRIEIKNRVKGQGAERPIPYFKYKSAVEDENENEDEPSRGEYYQKAYLSWTSLIGSGGFADVYSIKITNNNDPSAITFKYGKDLLALKVLRNSRLDNDKWVVLRSLDHSNIVKYIAFGQLPVSPNALLPSLNPQTAILMEYYAGGNLNTYSSNEDHTEGELMRMLQQVADGLQYLHGYGRIVSKTPLFHGNLKGENIFLTADQKHCKIGDLENHHLLVHEKTITGGFRANQGTLRHMSPEMLQYTFGDDSSSATGIGRASDIWSFGCTVLELFDKGKVEYRTVDGTVIPLECPAPAQQHSTDVVHPDKQFAKFVAHGAYPDLSTPGAQRMSVAFRCIVERCFSRTATARPSSAELYEAITTMLTDKTNSQ
ncbi:hypothetical protein BV898_12412 [Hypsibius exemplaris]|uniref:Protein kinase domain-containing protein n=1 Tax=Hypsibius exemplaris TaxID=2072580 RepID=A0A1W0WDV7_HYPEX|nr:hypothetical protein BV898_12412 [Hypsibius exemplaris]